MPAEHVDRVWGDFSRDAGVGRRELPSGVTPSSAGAGRGTTVPTQPPVSLANSLPRVQETKALTRAQRIAEMERENDPTNPDYLPVTDNAVKALQTDARGGMDAKRTRTPGRVLDADIPPVSAKSVAQDVAAGALKIGPTVVKGVGDIARLASADRVGKGLTEFADRGTQAIQEVVGSDRSNAQQTRFNQDIADPAMNAVDVVVGNPGALSDQVLPTLGSMALPVGVGAAAGKLATTSRAAQLARVIDEASVINRANTVRNAGVLGATVAQNAAGTFSDIRDDGGDLGEAYAGAAVTVPATVIASKMTGGGAEGNVSNMLAGTARGAAKEIPKAMLKEGAQEVVEEGGQYAGETIGKGEQFDANAAGKRLAVAGTLGAVMGGGVEAAGAARELRIKTLRDAGETAAADLLQQKHEKASAAEAVDAELNAMPGNEGFAQHYRALRTAGVKPAEAAARSAVSVTFQGLAQQTGVPDKALQVAMTAAKDMPLDKVPGFFQRFTEGLAKRGLIQPTDTLAAISTSLETARDEAMDAAIGNAYQPVKSMMNAVQALENPANQSQVPDTPAQAATETIANVQDPTQAPSAGAEAQATPAQAPAAMGGNAAGTEGLPGAGGATVQAFGVDGGRTSMYRTDMQTGQLLRLANLETASEADRQAAKDEVKRREVEAMYAGLETKPNERAQQEKAILEAARDEKVDQAVALTSAQEVDAPFKTRKAADDARKLNPMMRVVRAEGGYALTEKTPAQLAAQEKAAKRLRNPQTSAPGEPIPAHAMIAAAGGLAPSTRADMGMQGNVQIGNRKLFAGDGKGLTIERATERLVEDGYLPEGASHDDARNLIKRSLTKPQYNAEGYERLAELDSMERFDAAQLDEDEAVAEIEALSDTQFDTLMDADIPWDAASNTDTESAMRALGFSEQEISDAIANEPGEPQSGSESGGGVDGAPPAKRKSFWKTKRDDAKA